MSSWFIKVTDFNKKMSDLNSGVNWTPKTVGEKRFGNWLENAKDWGVSRSRYWGTSIPIWKSEDGSEVEILGSVKDIKDRTRGDNKYYVMRHGEAEHNVSKTTSSDNSVPSHLTNNGKEYIKNIAKDLKSKNIDLVYYSPLFRTKETAEILATELGLTKSKLSKMTE